jgi:threonine/homoserine/homoserine lactone efflux protein
MLGVSSIATGVAIGLSVTVPVGPMAILCIQRTLNDGLKAGISTGAGATTVQVAYASLVLLGFQHAAVFLEGNRLAMGIASAALMLLFAWRLVTRQRRVRATGRRALPMTVPGLEAGSIAHNYATALAFNGLNPMLLLLLIGAVGAMVGPQPPLGPTVSMLLLGVFLGSISWWILLSIVAAACRGQFGSRFAQGVNRVAAAGMVAFAALSIARAFGV